MVRPYSGEPQERTITIRMPQSLHTRLLAAVPRLRILLGDPYYSMNRLCVDVLGGAVHEHENVIETAKAEEPAA